MFAKLLIANRGEIACRVMRTARRLGIHTVAVYSDADADAMHVAMADEAVRIGPAAAAESYLKIDSVIDAARRTCAAAAHPGYGFLSENEAFARACADAGVAFVGPPAAAIRAMGSKSEAKAIMDRAGVPLVPGYHGDDQTDVTLRKEVDRIGYPVLIKAVAGGGGKGMRRVDRAKDLAEALTGARREAKAAFADDRVLIEKYVLQPRHVEVQVFADARGNAVHLFERDCSIQRRHQKVVEEAPAPGLTPALRDALGAAAVAAAKAIGYVGAGTVEFLLDRNGAFYFMEMNTRLQVEHPVTEMITGLDLVEWQLRVAAGEPLPLDQSRIAFRGHAIEARIYAEDPGRGFLPATGRLTHLRWPAESVTVRIDAGVRAGDEISVHYDPMIAKLVVRGEDRAAAVRNLRSALAATQIAGPRHNVEFLRAVAAHPAFAAGDLDTSFIDRHRADLLPDDPAQALLDAWAIVAAELSLYQEQIAREAALTSGDPWSPWSRGDGWRLNGEGHGEIRLRADGTLHKIAVTYKPGGYLFELPQGRCFVRAARLADGDIRVDIDGRQTTGTVARSGPAITVFTAGGTAQFELVDPLTASAALDAAPGHLAAPMPGKVIEVAVKPGDVVTRGATLMVLEAMKMEHSIAAPMDGTIERVFFKAGDLVEEGAELLAFADDPK
ncbi:MAG: acetyl-CoA carboxylase biotin carboxylase subunit [Dongiaceae bacterium]